jgi:hypothetical protein
MACYLLRKLLEAISKPHLTPDGCVARLLFCFAKLKPRHLVAPLSTHFALYVRPFRRWRSGGLCKMLTYYLYAALFHLSAVLSAIARKGEGGSLDEGGSALALPLVAI